MSNTKGLPPLVTELMARGGRLAADGGNVGDNVGGNVGGNVGDNVADNIGDEDEGNHYCVRLAEQLRLTAESLAAFLSSIDRFFLTISFHFCCWWTVTNSQSSTSKALTWIQCKLGKQYLVKKFFPVLAYFSTFAIFTS